MTTIWRYMDLWKFESLLSKRALFFSASAGQIDQLEGIYPPATKAILARQFGHLPEDQQRYVLHNHEVFEQVAKNDIVISCWHINDNENPRMWNEYVEAGKGIVIQTTVDALKGSFAAFSHPQLIKIEKVQYINRATFRGPLLNDRMDVFFQKVESFSWENELRCAVDVTLCPLSDDPNGKWNAEHVFVKGRPYPVGYFIPIEVSTLIEKVIVSPKSSCMFQARVRVLCRRYGLNKPIECSSSA